MKKEKVQQNELADYLGVKPSELEKIKSIDFDKARASITTIGQIGKDMKLLLKVAKITYSELAEVLGTSKPNINRWVNKPESWDLETLDQALVYIKKKWPYKNKT